MKKQKILVFIIFLIFLSFSSARKKTASSNYEQKLDDCFFESFIVEPIIAPSLLNISQLDIYDYHKSICLNSSFKWKVSDFEEVESFQVTEGDKELKPGIRIILNITNNPWLKRTEPHTWALLYVNGLIARYPNIASHNHAVYKYFQPIYLNLVENFTSDYYSSPEFLNYYEDNFNYTSDFVGDYFGKIFNYTELGFFSYLENSPFIDRSLWIFKEELVTYKNTIISEINNRTEISIGFERETGLMNKLQYNASFINGTGYPIDICFEIIKFEEEPIPTSGPTKKISFYLIVSVMGMLKVVIVVRLYRRRIKSHN